MAKKSRQKLVKCCKCNSDSRGGSWRIEGGEHYRFCRGCSAILENKKGCSLLANFLNGSLEIGSVAKNMIEARKRRAKGDLLWSE